MKRARVIPVLLLQKGGLVKSVKFKDHKYVGDPINAVKIFNEKEVDEIVILDISATAEKRGPDIAAIKEIAGEAFMPLAYGGGITKLDEIKMLITAGIEKVILNTSAYHLPNLITAGAGYVGSQSIVVSIDVKKNLFGKHKVMIENGSKHISSDPVAFAKQMEQAGAGELCIQSIDRDGTFEGYDLFMIQKISEAVTIPVVALGGASSLNDFVYALQHGASAVAAGSMFVFQRTHRAVLISYPGQAELKEKVYSKI
jgi:imidazole glycerol-phosphate synthase subunit HisF